MQYSHSSLADRDTDERLLMLSPGDNVAVVLRALSEDEKIQVRGREVRVHAHIAMGHKIAIARVEPGSKIIKYGAPIGLATRPIDIGDHVHLHNIRSDYTPSHSLDGAREENSDDV